MQTFVFKDYEHSKRDKRERGLAKVNWLHGFFCAPLVTIL